MPKQVGNQVIKTFVAMGALKMREWKMHEWKLQEKTAGVEIAGVENTGGKHVQSRPYRNLGMSKLESVCV